MVGRRLTMVGRRRMPERRTEVLVVGVCSWERLFCQRSVSSDETGTVDGWERGCRALYEG